MPSVELSNGVKIRVRVRVGIRVRIRVSVRPGLSNGLWGVHLRPRSGAAAYRE